MGLQLTHVGDTSSLGRNSGPNILVPTAAPGPTLQISPQLDRHAISPYIYGMNFADETFAQELKLPVNRFGGNATTRYNWQNDTSNHASDWYFENIPEANSNPGALPNESTTDRFVDQDRRTQTQTIMTLPLIGWTPKSRAIACGFSVAKYGAQQSTDPWQPDCGNGVHTNGSEITGNDPLDTSTAIDPTFVQGWINHLISRYNTAAQGGVKFYDLDNEPALWNSTHRDVHPTPVSYDELRDRTYQYAAAVKATDSSAFTLGPVAWGWVEYFYSAKDVADGGAWWNTRSDRRAHGDIPLTDWYLQQMKLYEQQHGTRILDYLDLHYYPQALGVTLSPAGDSNTQALRLRSTRSLWDPTYVDESWINDTVRLIPRMRDWVQQNYPGTKPAITEYNWGGLEHINGALAQADVLGIFGRENLDLATLWDPPSNNQPGAFAFRIYLNYDGVGGTFGQTSVRATSTDQSQLAIYAAERGDGKLTAIVINKTSQDLTSTVQFTGYSQAQVYRYSSANSNAIVRQADQAIGSSGFSHTFPANSITLFVMTSITITTSAAFRVERSTGNIFADGSYNCGLGFPGPVTPPAAPCFNTGIGADVAEHINSLEILEPGDVVEIDPEHPNLFRKSRGNADLVVGVISSRPGIIMANRAFGQDSRASLALIGRASVKASSENGSIYPGDLLTVSFTKPGFVTRCDNSNNCEAVGKALGSLSHGTGIILMLIMR
ncbi:glycoside hydrolase family 44 protein [Candidatus Acetothermia bacterium]|nr:glycoside hydrolase family 44 protein [Candidatus Acetothermia bacterium]